MAEHELNKIVDDEGEVFNLRDSTKQPTADRVTSWGSTPSDTKYPSEKLVKDSLDAKVSSVKKNGSTFNPSSGVVDIGYIPTARQPSSGSVESIIQALRVSPGGSIGSVQVNASSTISGVTIPAQWYNYIWLPHRTGQPADDNQNFGSLILTPLTTTPDFYVVEGSALNNASPTYRAKRISNSSYMLVPEGDNRSVATTPNDYSNSFVFRGIKTNSTIGSPSSDSYSYVIGLRGYQNNSGGNAYEIAFNNSGVFFRSGATTEWSAWKKLITNDSLFLYANLGWGGKFRTSLSPIDTYLFYSQNAFFGLKPSAVNVEYSNDGGTTWVDYGLTDDQKRQLFSQYNNCSIYCGKAVHVHPGYTGTLGTYHDLSDENIADQRIRITLCCLSNAAAGTSATTDKWIYCKLRRLAVYMSTQSASKGPTHFKITGRKRPDFIADNDTWYNLGDFGILGDSGWNSIPMNNETTENGIEFGNSYDGQYTQFRFEIWSESLNATPNAGQTGDLLIQKILGFSELLWQNNTTNSNMASYGSPYTVNPVNGVAHFGKGITSGVAIPIGSGGTGKTTAKAAEYNLTTGKSEISDTTSGDDRVVFELASPSESNGVTRGFRKLSTIWTWIKGLLSSESGVNISGSSASCTGNAATATAAQSGSALETAINGKMNTSASNATAPSGSGGDGATATLLNNLTDGNSDIVTTDDGDNVLIATTDNGGSVTNKWYKRKLVKLIPWIIKKLGTRLVYDCGAGSTSGDDFDAALAAFNAGQWVIIHSSSGVYYCVGTYSGGLRFKKLSNEASLLKVDTITWNRGSAPTAGNQIEASLSGHTHGNITSDGKLQTDAESIGSGDSLVVTDYSNSGKIARTSVTFDGTTTSKALTPKGTWETFVQDVSGKMNTNAGNAASGALQNLTGQLSEGTRPFTDNTEMFTSYAGNSGFAESGHVNQPYRRKASSMLNYIESKRFYERNPADNSVGTDTKRIQLGYGAYGSGFVGYCCYIVHIFFNLVGGSLQGKGVTLLVNYDWRDTQYQSAKCQILSDNGLIDAGYQIVLANFKSDNNSKVHVCLGLVSTSAPTTLVQFAYSYCKIFRLCSGLNWTHSIASDNVGSYNDLIPSEYVKAISIGNANVGNANQPVYFSNGVPVACNWWVS